MSVRLSKPSIQQKSTSTFDVCIVGAGPYGLSVATHLQKIGMDVRIFGQPMEFWANKMPEGMLLRSPRVASNLSDPDHAFTLEAYEAVSKTEACAPLPLDTFVEYGRWFRHQLGSASDTRSVCRIDLCMPGFKLIMDDGEEVRSKFVVIAAGIGPFKNKPEVFRSLPSEKCMHCYEHRNVKAFADKRVAVIGAGQSALESAALLHEAGAEVEIIARQSELRWIGQHSWLHKMGPISAALYSSHDVGPIGISRLVAYPKLTRLVPPGLRDKIRKRAVRPAGSRWLPDRLKNVKVTTERFIKKAKTAQDEVHLVLNDGSERRVEHVLLGTGYRVDISQYEFLPAEVVKQIQQFDGYPKLASGFRCSVPGLHFIGATAARTFGPLLYFVAGTEFASRELSSHLQKHATRL
jgi:cation diffusion facilitator CzcD-associated flavoprotein CzcO